MSHTWPLKNRENLSVTLVIKNAYFKNTCVSKL